MSGVKRKLSRPTSSGRPAKFLKQATDSTVSADREDSLPRKPFAPVKLRSKKRSSSGPDISSLRRASTLPVEDEAPKDPKPVDKPVVALRQITSGTTVGVTRTCDTSLTLTTQITTLLRTESISHSTSGTSKTVSVSSLRRGGSRKKTHETGQTESSSSDKDGILGNASIVKKKSGTRQLIAADDESSGAKEEASLPTGRLVEIVISFDTTNSMSRCFGTVRGRISELIQRLEADTPGIRIAIFAHGDYSSTAYVTTWLDFGSTLPELCEFVRNISKTDGGHGAKCYELVLRQVQEELSWTPGSQRSLIMIGDENPHTQSHPDNKLNIAWEEECKKLDQMCVKIYGIHVKKSPLSEKFYRGLASLTSGRYLSMDRLSSIFEIIRAISYREMGNESFRKYEEEVRRLQEGVVLHKDLDKAFNELGGEDKTVRIEGQTKKVSSAGKTKKGSENKVGTRAVSKKPQTGIKTPALKRMTRTKKSAKAAASAHKNSSAVKKIPTRVASPVRNIKPRKVRYTSQKKKLAPKKKLRRNVPDTYSF